MSYDFTDRNNMVGKKPRQIYWTEIQDAINDIDDNKIGDLPQLKTTSKSSLVDSINELFTFVSDGKQLIATAITGKGIDADGSESFTSLANKISQIETGDYSIGDVLYEQNIEYVPFQIWTFYVSSGYVNSVAVDNNGYVYSGSFYKVKKTDEAYKIIS